MTKDYNYDLAQSRIQREQMMAALAQQMAFAPAMNGNATSPLHILASMLSAYAANKRLNNADKLRQDYSVNLNAGHQRDMTEFNALKDREGLEAALAAVGSSTNPYTRDAMQEYRKVLAKGTVTNKDLIPLANKQDVLNNPNNPKDWGLRRNIKTVGGVAFDENTLQPIKLDIPPEANQPIQIGPDLYKSNYSTGGLSQLNKAPRINTTVVNGAQTHGMKKIYDMAAEDLGARREQVRGAAGMIRTLDELENLDKKGIFSNALASPAAYITNLAQGVGIPVSEELTKKLGRTETYEAASIELWQRMISMLGGNKYVTEKESALIMKMLPRIQSSPEARQYINGVLRRAAGKSMQDYRNMADSYKRAVETQDPAHLLSLDPILPEEASRTIDSDLNPPSGNMSIDELMQKFKR